MNSNNDPQFRTTQWSIVLEARGESATRALEQLCQCYWYPLYAFVRRKGHRAAEAQDLTQEFFSCLLEKRWLNAVERERGKFRTFLMMAMKRFLANEWDHSHRLKRGGENAVLSLDAIEAEKRFEAESANTSSDPSLLYDRGWALSLLDRSLKIVEAEQDPEKFAALKPSLISGKGDFDCSVAAQALGVSDGTARVAVHRLRKRYREILRNEIAQTVSGPSEVDDEVLYLINILAKG